MLKASHDLPLNMLEAKHSIEVFADQLSISDSQLTNCVTTTAWESQVSKPPAVQQKTACRAINISRCITSFTLFSNVAVTGLEKWLPADHLHLHCTALHCITSTISSIHYTLHNVYTLVSMGTTTQIHS